MIDLLLPLFLFLTGLLFLFRKFTAKIRLPLYFFFALFLYSFHRFFSPIPEACEVYKGSTAEELGWKTHDKILSINGVEIRNMNDLLEFARTLDGTRNTFYLNLSAQILRGEEKLILPMRVLPIEKPSLYEPIGMKRLVSLTGGLGFSCRQPIFFSTPSNLIRNQQNKFYTYPSARVVDFGDALEVNTIEEIDNIINSSKDDSVISMQTQYGWEKKTFRLPLFNFYTNSQSGSLLARKLALGIPDIGETISSIGYDRLIDYGLLPGYRILKIDGIDPINVHKIQSIFEEKTKDGTTQISILFYKSQEDRIIEKSISHSSHSTSLGLSLVPDIIRVPNANLYPYIISLFIYPTSSIYQITLTGWKTLYHALRRDLGFSFSWYRLPFFYFSSIDFWLWKLSQIFLILFIVESAFQFSPIKKSRYEFVCILSISLLLLANSIWIQYEI